MRQLHTLTFGQQNEQECQTISLNTRHKLRQQLAVTLEVFGQKCQIESAISFVFVFFFSFRKLLCVSQISYVEEYFFYSLELHLLFFFQEILPLHSAVFLCVLFSCFYCNVYFPPSVSLFIRFTFMFGVILWLVYYVYSFGSYTKGFGSVDTPISTNRPCLSKDIYPYSICFQFNFLKCFYWPKLFTYNHVSARKCTYFLEDF